MEYNAVISAKVKDEEALVKALKAEEQEKKRASISVIKEKDSVKINIDAEDPVALRASLNAVCQFLTIQNNLGE
jgi:tRNA threonylcarbamoyladenosine modification (KEOPS) complex  Pcc1 subunit